MSSINQAFFQRLSANIFVANGKRLKVLVK